MMKAFVEDDQPEAYAEMLDKLLISPAFGEHWASMWPDLARSSGINKLGRGRRR